MKKTIALLALSLLVLTACVSQRSGEEISRERAIELARQHIDFEPGKVEAVQDTEEGRLVWRVTFYGKGVDAAHPGQVSFVVLDRRTGEVVSLGMS
jgi:peptidase YpeB-like protein